MPRDWLRFQGAHNDDRKQDKASCGCLLFAILLVDKTLNGGGAVDERDRKGTNDLGLLACIEPGVSFVGAYSSLILILGSC